MKARRVLANQRGLCAIALCAAVALSSCGLSPESVLLPLLAPPEDELRVRVALRSEATGTEYTLYVCLPEGYPGGAPVGGYPTVYLLDGDSSVARLDRDLRRMAASAAARPAILVGIGYGAGKCMRARDYTPTPNAGDSLKGFDWGEPGGAGAFADFLERELVPAIEERFAVERNPARRYLLGHSLGGLFAAWMALERPGLFGGYCCASPSFWWDSGYIFSVERTRAGIAADLPSRWYLGWTTGEGGDMGLYAAALLERLESRLYPSLRLASAAEHTGQHTTSWFGIYPKALAFLLGGDDER